MPLEVDPNIDPSAQENLLPAVPVSELDTSATPVLSYEAQYNSNSDTWRVVDSTTGTVVAFGLTEQQAQLQAQEQTFADQVLPAAQDQLPGQNPYSDLHGPAFDEQGNLNPGFALDSNDTPYFAGYNYVEPRTLASAEASRTQAAKNRAQRQQTILNQQRQLNQADWRVRLSLASQSSYLYNVPNAGILAPLWPTNGVIFPYTPQITTNYRANYNSYDLTHSNYRGYYYQNSYTDTVSVSGVFTAQNTKEADYLLAVIHFFRSVTKMFYGQSQNLGSPPPICYLNGLGEYQFNKHPVLVTNFAYTLPNSVDYIRAGSSNNLQLNQTALRARTNTINPALSSVQRLLNARLVKGASSASTPPPPAQPNTNNPTYVPTRMEITITLLPVQSRTQVSQQFNLQTFANGDQLRGGFW